MSGTNFENGGLVGGLVLLGFVFSCSFMNHSVHNENWSLIVIGFSICLLVIYVAVHWNGY